MYLAPEIIAGNPATTRSDIYSLGVVLYQLLIGDFRRPITGDWAQAVPDPLIREDLEHCFAWNSEQRFAGAGQLATNLRRWEHRKAEQAERERLRRKAEQRYRLFVAAAGTALVLVTIAMALGYGFWRTRQARDLAEAHAYAADMNLAQQALLADDLGKARRLLDRYRPNSGRAHLRGFEWRYLAAEARSDYTAIEASSSNAVLRLALSPDGRTIAVGRLFGGIELWDPTSLKRIATLETNVGFAAGVAFSPKGGLLAAAAPGQGIRLWQLDPLRIVGELVHTNVANRITFSPDGRHLASYHLGSGLCVWELERHEIVRRYPDLKFRGDGYGGGPICFSPDGSRLAVGDVSGHIYVLDWAANPVPVDIPAHSQMVTGLAYSPDGRLLASGGGYAPDNIRLWSPATGQPAGSLEGHRSWVCVLQFSGDSHRLFSGSGDQTIGIWDVPGRKLISKLRGHLDEIYSLALDGRGAGLITGCMDGTLARWELDKVRSQAFRFDLPVQAMVAGHAAGGSSVAVLDQQRAVALWRPGDPQPLSVVTPLGTNNVALATASRRGLLASSTAEGPVRIWSLASVNLVTNLNGHFRPVHRLEFSGKEDFLVAGNASGQSTIWDAKTWIKRSSVTEAKAATCGALSPDGRLLVLGLFDGHLAWWDAVRGQRLAETIGHRILVNGLDFSPDGITLASVSGDGTAALWDTRTRRRTAYFPKASFTGLGDVAFSPDGSRLAIGLVQGQARLYDLRTLRELITAGPPGKVFYRVEFSPSGDALLCGAGDGHCYLWRAPSFAELDVGSEGNRQP
jgi:WD40 repeat protein